MIHEGGVLLRVQHFKQGCTRVSMDARCHFVHLVKKEDRVIHSCSLHSLNEPAGHTANIGSSVAAYVRLVSHAPK